jgi:hypothetical protein
MVTTPCRRIAGPFGLLRIQEGSIMKTFFIDRYKSKDGLRFGEMPNPELRDDDVMVQVYAAGVNLLDAKIKDGEFKLILPYRLPLILGNDVAGVVVRIGSKVRRFKAGDEVYARPRQDRIGTFAEFIAMNENDVAMKPKALTMEEAASIPLVGLTAIQDIDQAIRLDSKNAFVSTARRRLLGQGRARSCDPELRSGHPAQSAQCLSFRRPEAMPISSWATWIMPSPT